MADKAKFPTAHVTNPAHAGRPLTLHVFTREQVVLGDPAPFASAFSPEKLASEALRQAYDSLTWGLADFEKDTRAAYEIPEVRAFFGALHRAWPYAFFFFNIPAADLRTYLFCRLTTLTVERRTGMTAPVVSYSRNELFQLIGRDFEPLERACRRSGLSADVFRHRARQILVMFGFLKP